MTTVTEVAGVVAVKDADHARMKFCLTMLQKGLE